MIKVGLKATRGLNRLLKKLDQNSMRVRDWQILYKSLGGLLTIVQVAYKAQNDAPIFRELCQLVNQDVYSLRNLMHRIIDFELTKLGQSVVIKYGVDSDLDRKRSIHNSLPNFLTAVGKEEQREVDVFGIEKLHITYLPQVGFVVSVPSQVEGESKPYQLPGLYHETK